MADREDFAAEVGGLIKEVRDLVDARLAALERDTKWRLVSLASGTGGQLFLRREGGWVSVLVNGFRPAATGVNLLAELPAGFRPRFTGPHSWADEQGSPRPVYALAYSPYRLEVRTIAIVGSYVYASGGWHTSDPWPTTLPGSPA